jgi:hypothetical protein
MGIVVDCGRVICRVDRNWPEGFSKGIGSFHKFIIELWRVFESGVVYGWTWFGSGEKANRIESNSFQNS